MTPDLCLKHRIQKPPWSSITLEAIPKTKYVDQGATMRHDYVDGNVKSAVKTRYENGKKPNYAAPGTYRAYYDCKDHMTRLSKFWSVKYLYLGSRSFSPLFAV